MATRTSSAASAASSSSWPPAKWTDDRAMGFYLAPIGGADEEERTQKLSFWRDAFLAYQEARHAAHTPDAGSTSPPAATPAAAKQASLSFTLQEVQKAMARRGEISSALEVVLCQLLSSGEIRSVASYAAAAGGGASGSSSLAAASAVVGKVGGYLWSFVSPTKQKASAHSQAKLPPGRYVLVDQVDQAASELIQTVEQHQHRDAMMDVFTLEQLQQIAGRSQADVLLLIQHMHSSDVSTRPHRLFEAFPAPAEGDLASSVGSTRVFKLASTASGVSSADHARALLRVTIAQLRARADEKEAYANEREKEARRLVQQKRRPLALIQLQMKKRCLSQLHTLHAQLDNLDVVLSHLEQSLSQSEFLACLRTANQTLRQIRREVSVDDVQAVTDELAEQMDTVRIVEDSLGQAVTTDLADADVDAEFAALEKQIAQEEEAQKNSITTTATAPTATAANKSQPIAKATMQTAM